MKTTLTALGLATALTLSPLAALAASDSSPSIEGEASVDDSGNKPAGAQMKGMDMKNMNKAQGQDGQAGGMKGMMGMQGQNAQQNAQQGMAGMQGMQGMGGMEGMQEMMTQMQEMMKAMTRMLNAMADNIEKTGTTPGLNTENSAN